MEMREVQGGESESLYFRDCGWVIGRGGVYV